MNTPTRMALAALLALAVAAPVAAAKKTETRDVSGFNGIGLSAPIQVELTLGEHDSVVLEGDEALLARIETVVEKGSLKIRRKHGAAEWPLRLKGDAVRARVTARRIDALAVAGSGDIAAPQLAGESLAISIAGSGDVAVGGKVATLSVHISGSGDVKAAKLDAQSVSVSISGSGDALVWARQALSVQVAGSGDVRYYGDPTVARSIAGTGSVRRVGAAPT
jgi:Putative auto-transporter adhesin, head GIN domain